MGRWLAFAAPQLAQHATAAMSNQLWSAFAIQANVLGLHTRQALVLHDWLHDRAEAVDRVQEARRKVQDSFGMPPGHTRR